MRSDSLFHSFAANGRENSKTCKTSETSEKDPKDVKDKKDPKDGLQNKFDLIVHQVLTKFGSFLVLSSPF